MTVIQLHQSIEIKVNLFLERHNKAAVQKATYESIESNVLEKLDEKFKTLDDKKYSLTIIVT